MTLLHSMDDLDAVFSRLFGSPFNFSPPQVAAITAPLDRPGVIIAGAGSGKTTVMAARVVWLVGHHGLDPDRILGLTFTNKAAGELGLRVRRALAALLAEADEAPTDPTTSTYHAFAGTLINEHGLRLGRETDLRILSDASRFQRMARVVESYDQPLQHVSTHVPTLINQTMVLDGQLSDHLVDTEELRRFDTEVIAELATVDKAYALHEKIADACHKRLELSRLVDLYRAAKTRDGVMDFSDQMAWGAELSAVDDVGAELRSRYDAVLLDEYQDTSVAQRDLLQNLFAWAPGRDDAPSLTAVGDPAQGIYGWRGAASGNLTEFLTDFPAADGLPGRPYALVESRRCAVDVIGAANDLAADFYATSDVVQPLAAHADSPAGHVTVALHETVAHEIDDLVVQVQKAIADGVPRHEIAILVRITRENDAIVRALRSAEVPFEVVGLSGLLSQPEVQDLLALLGVLDDVTDNPAMLRLLTGPRWRIGQRDLRLLGRRATALSGRAGGRVSDGDLMDQLARAVEGADPTEITSLADAVEDPGDLRYSAEARVRFSSLSKMISGLRRHVGEPLPELARRAMYALDLDVELEAVGHSSGLDNLALLHDAIAAYAEDDRFASLSGLLAYLAAEEQFNDGMEVSTPSTADSVKLLTVHRAKGLEWHTVFVPFLSAKVFPGGKGRNRWFSSPSVLPVPLRGDAANVPDLVEFTAAAEKVFGEANKLDALMEERRLGYVAYTRAKHDLHLSGHWWGRTQIGARGPSSFLLGTRDWIVASGGSVRHWEPEPSPEAVNPMTELQERMAWPASLPRLEQRRELADLVEQHLDGIPSARPPVRPDDHAALRELDVIEAELELLVAEADRATDPVRVVALPATLSATAALEMEADPQRFARHLARPMPRQPSPAARFGTRFHAWVEARFGQQTLLDPVDLPGQADPHIETDDELRALTQLFADGPYGEQSPHRVEVPFSIMLGGQQVVGRIDAVYQTADGFDVVDWKTNRAATADPLQLAIYRLAWAELNGIDPLAVTGVFYYVRLGDVKRYTDLPDRAELEKRLGLA
ncbi:MAG: ATP-dependent helicase [Aeromicrobium sp.]|nr:ATP-dependent helicase [Aeromicrobium sp.]